MSNARTRLRRMARAADAIAMDARWRANPLMAAPLAYARHTPELRPEDARQPLPRNLTAYAWNADTGRWERTEARDRKPVATLFDTPLDPAVAIARSNMARISRALEDAATVTRERDDSATTTRPLTQRERRARGADAVETWATKES